MLKNHSLLALSTLTLAVSLSASASTSGDPARVDCKLVKYATDPNESGLDRLKISELKRWSIPTARNEASRSIREEFPGEGLHASVSLVLASGKMRVAELTLERSGYFVTTTGHGSQALSVRFEDPSGVQYILDCR